ncbi:MAG: hypothetical protein EBT30_08795 [Verrucomicrobia bacterium]|nr:hypothetical protein [Verrucomicrobiota bacterium]
MRNAIVTVGSLDGVVAGEILGVTTATGTFSDKNVGAGKNVAVVYTLADGANPLHLASNYSLAGETLTSDITAKDLVVNAGGLTSRSLPPLCRATPQPTTTENTSATKM